MNITDSTMFKLEEITEIEHTNILHNMIDITVKDDESFILNDGTVSHNSAMASLLVVRDPKKHGGYPLRGKILNTHGLSTTAITSNTELLELMSIIGLSLDTPSINEDPNMLYEIEYEGEQFIAGAKDIIILKDGTQVKVSTII